MTDKAKIRAEIEKRYRDNKADGYSDVCEELWDILSFIDSMQEEPISEPVDFEKELYKAFGQVKDFTLGMRIAKRFYDMGKNSQEPVSEDLEEAGKKWLSPQLDKSYAAYGETKQMELTHFDGYAMLDAIEFGAQWQQAKDSIPAEYLEEAVNAYIGYAPEVDESSSTYGKRQAFKAGAEWQKTKDESTTEDLGEYINELSKQFPEVSFAKLSRIAVRVAKWQKLKDMGITNNAKGVVTNILNSSDKPLDIYAAEVAFIMIPANLTENYHMTNRDRISDAVRLGAKWQKEQFEKNRITACDRQTEEEAEREKDFVMGIIENEHRKPTFDDAIKYGMRLQRENMMQDATDVTVHIEAGNYPYIPQIELYDYDKDVPLAKEGDKYKVVLIKEC